MELKNGHKQTELGFSPGDWRIKTIAEVAVILDNLRKPLSDNVRLKMQGDIPYCGANNIVDYVNDYIIDDDIILVAEDGGNFEQYKTRPIAYRMSGKCWVNNHAHILKAKSGVCQDYLFYTLVHKNILDFINGGTRAKLNKGELIKIEITVPNNVHEQTVIAKALSEADEYIASLEKLIDKKRQIKQGAMQELLKPKDGWVEKLLIDTVDFTHGKAHEQFIVEDGAFCVVNSKFISTEGKVSKFSNQSFLTAKKNDILTVLSDLPNGKALAKCFFVERNHYYAVNQRICIWRSKNADPKFLFYLLNRHPYFLALNDGVSQTHILNHHIKKCSIIIPINKSDQENIGNILTSMDEELTALEAKLEKAKSIKYGMMQNLLTGKIRLI